MSNNEHSITLPPNLRRLWAQQAQRMAPHDPVAWQEHVADQAARWGYEQRGAVNEAELQKARDEELEACRCFLLTRPEADYGPLADELRAARRPKAVSLKAGAIEVLDELDGLFELPAGYYNTILRALEQLNDSI